MEDKREITKALFECVKLTRAGEDIADMEYVKDNGNEDVYITYSDGYEKRINVNFDSGTALIRDVMRGIQ